MIIKPMLATDADMKKLRFPLWIQPKYDGVRGLHLNGTMTGRSLKPHANRYATTKFSHPAYAGLDGEFTVGEITDEACCRNTTSALNTITGEPNLTWHVFDRITPYTLHLPYHHRYERLAAHLMQGIPFESACYLRLMPTEIANDMDQLLTQENIWLAQGYEGLIIRDPAGKYKQGRSTIREQGLLRVKRFIEEDALVIAVIEGQTNGNTATINELGRTERSSHQENMQPNGMVGALLCRVLKDIYDPIRPDVILLHKDQEITVSAGSMPHKNRVYFFQNQAELILQVIKFKFFPKGVKDKPRFPTFVSLRAKSDLL